MSDIQLEILNEKQLQDFLKTIDQHNRFTLTRYWTQAKARKLLLLVRRIGPRQCQICQIPPQELHVKKILPRFHIGTLFLPGFPENVYRIFGTDEVLTICASKTAETRPQDICTTPEPPKRILVRPAMQEEPKPKKKRGRPRKNENS